MVQSFLHNLRTGGGYQADLLAAKFEHDFSLGPPPGEAGGWAAPALNELDCLLSQHRPYARLVLPRLNK
jgi:hypothetical protein